MNVSDGLYVLTILCALVVVSNWLAKHKIGRSIGAALIVIILGAICANAGIIPTASNSIPLYDAIFTYLAPLSIFYLLLGVNLTKIKKAGMPMVILFLIGSLGTIVGVIGSYYLLNSSDSLGDYAAKIAGMLGGTYTGGSINFNAVALHYKVNETGVLYAGTVAVDNVITTLWILITLAMPRIMGFIWKGKQVSSVADAPKKVKIKSLDLKYLAILLSVGLFVVWFSQWLLQYLPQIPSILTLTTIGLVLAQFKYFHELPGSELIGLYAIYLFLAVVGAYCEINAVRELGEIGYELLKFTALTVLIHGIIITFLGKWTVGDWDMIAIASQANIGGSTTAMVMAESFGRKELIVPAILIGTLGNALGTYFGFLVVGLLSG